ncbi:MAG: hypothetical protein WCP45_06725 [Verrucomicrobiota bacterium]
MTGTPSPTPLAEPSLQTGAQHPVLRECLESGRRFEEEYKAGDPLILEALDRFRGDSQPSQASEKPQG